MMNSPEDMSPIAIPTDYDLPPNTEIILYEGNIVIAQNDVVAERLSGTGKIYWDWFPKPCIKFLIYCENQNLNGTDLIGKKINIELLDINQSAEVKSLSVEIREVNDRRCKLIDYLSDIRYQILGDRFIPKSTSQCLFEGVLVEHQASTNQDVKKLKFHIINFSDYTGESISDPISLMRNDRLPLHTNEWKITIDIIDRKKIKKLRDKGGYAITHVAILEKSDGTNFNCEESENILSALNYFLSFIMGQWSSPLFATGYDTNNVKIWDKWTYFHITSFVERKSWFPKQNLGDIPSLFEKFLQLWNDPNWNESIKILCSLYIDGNSSRLVEERILLIQSALELLSWLILVREKHHLTDEQFKNRQAADLFRQLFNEFGISVNIPSSTDEYFTNHLEVLINPANSLRDAPDIITQIRNRIGHPRQVNGYSSILKFSGDQRIQTFFLSQWYLEMCLLHLFDYQGVYSNRLKLGTYEGNYETLPWST